MPDSNGWTIQGPDGAAIALPASSSPPASTDGWTIQPPAQPAAAAAPRPQFPLVGAPPVQVPAEPPHPRDQFNTPIPPAKQQAYQDWLDEQKQKLGRDISADHEDYDITGAFLAGAGSDDDRGHFPDTFKKPNHPTFSTESQYSGQPGGPVGGKWVEKDGKEFFYASPDNLKYRSANELQRYFNQYEPDTTLVLPKASPQIQAQETPPPVTPLTVFAQKPGTQTFQGPQGQRADLSTRYAYPDARSEFGAWLTSPPDSVKKAVSEFNQFMVGPFQIQQKAVVEPASSMVSPLGAALTATGAGLGLAGASGSARAVQAAKGADAAIGAFFAGESARQIVKDVPEAYDAYKKGDYWDALGDLGTAGTSAFLGSLAALHAHGQLGDLETIAATRRALQERLFSEETARATQAGREHRASVAQAPRIEAPAAEPPAQGTDLGDGWTLSPAADRIEGQISQAERQAVEERKPAQAAEPPQTAPENRAPEPAANPPATSSIPPNETATAAAPEARGPGWVGNIPTSEIQVDAPRFQFKRNVGEGGAGEELREVQQYDPEKAGIVSVWKDPADGQTYVVNGHHRVELAQRTGYPEMLVRYLNAENAPQARLKGALINIAEGRGESTDAAKVFRETGMTPEEAQKEGISVKGKVASEGLALSKLAQPIFDDVISGELSPARGAVLGNGLPSHADQQAVYDLIQQREQSGKRLTNDQVGELIRLNQRTSTVTERSDDSGQGGLFGVEEMTRSLLPEKAEVSDYVRGQLKSEKKLFGTVSTQAAADRLAEEGNVVRTSENQNRAEQANQGMALYDKLSTAAGPIDQVLDQSARRLADGENANVVKQEAYRAIRDHLTRQVRQLTGVSQEHVGRAQGVGEGGSHEVSGRKHNQMDAGGAGGHDTGTAGKGSAELEPGSLTQSVAPRMMARDEAYVPGQGTNFHAAVGHFEPFALDPADAKHAVAYLVNPSGMELVHRVSYPNSHQPDRAAQYVGGVHVSAQDMQYLAALAQKAMNRYGRLPGLVALRRAAAEALEQGKALILVKDFEGLADEHRQVSFREELHHTFQSALGHGESIGRFHLREKVNRFLEDPLARIATLHLQNRGYGGAPKPQLAAEIGVRLMDYGRYRELGLTYFQARNLAARYVRALRRIYGYTPARQIARLVFDALRERTAGGEEPGGLPRRTRTEGGGGTSGGAGPALSASENPEGPRVPIVHLGSVPAGRGSGADENDLARRVRADHPGSRGGSGAILSRFPNPDEGIEAVVAKHPKGFSVTLRDTEAGEYLPTSQIYPTLNQAEARARDIANTGSLFGKEAEKASQEETKASEARLLGERLTAQMKSGRPAKAPKIKPAQTGGLFDEPQAEQSSLFSNERENPNFLEEEDPDQGQLGLFGGSERGSFSLRPRGRTPNQPGSPAFTKRLAEQNKKYGEDVRSWFTARRDLWQARVNQELSRLRKVLPDPIDQEALAIYRDFKHRPGELAQYLAGTHAAFGEVRDLDKARAAIEQLRIPIERAMHPTPAMLTADRSLTRIAEASLKEGQRLGFIDQHVRPDEYVTHLLMKDEEESEPTFSEKFGKALGNKIGRNFPYNQQREFPTILEAAANGWKPRALNAFTAFQTYGDKFATARSTHLLIQHLRDANVGIWGAKGDKGIPRDWVEIAPHAHPFRNLGAHLNEEGEPEGHYQTLFVPPTIEKALRPITDPEYTSRIAGFRKLRIWQGYTKAAQLGLSYFHAMSENYMGLSAMGPSGYLKGLKADRFSPEFLEQERDFIGHGGTTSIQNKVYEKLGTVNVSSLPSFAEAWRSLAGVRHVDQVAARITDFTFGRLQRQFKVVNYALEKAAWMAEHPDPTPSEENSALRSIAAAVNGIYGGLHWENLGVNRMSLEMARAIMLAPDWTFSNFFNVKYAFGKTAGGKLSRMFWLRAILGGLAGTQLMSLMLSRKPSKRPTQVYLGKDPTGKDIYQNLFFKGAPGDVANLVYNVKDYGPIVGLARTMGNKVAPGVKSLVELMRNENFMGRPIVPKGMHPLAAAVRSAAEFGKGMAPVPWSITNMAEMLFGPDRAKYKIPLEVLTTLFAGTPPTHVTDKPPKPQQSILDQIMTGKVSAPSERPLPKNPAAAERARERRELRPR